MGGGPPKEHFGALLLCPCLFCPSDNVWRSRRADAPWCAHFSTVISPSWITEQISVGKCAHRAVSVHWEQQTSFKIVTSTKQTWTKHHNTTKTRYVYLCFKYFAPLVAKIGYKPGFESGTKSFNVLV